MTQTVLHTERFYSDNLVAGRTCEQRMDAALLSGQGIMPSLGVVLAEDPMLPGIVDGRSRSYVNRKVQHGDAIGARSTVFQVARYAVGSTIARLNTELDGLGEPLVHGTLLQLPLPSFPSESQYLLDRRTRPILTLLDPSKDVDGVRPRDPEVPFNEANEFAAPTPQGIMDILRATRVQDRVPLNPGTRVTVIGSEGFLVGRHMGPLLAKEGITPVNHDPKLYEHPISSSVLEDDMRSKISQTDILILCVGRAGLVTPDMLHNGMVVVDAGVSMVGGRLRGDLDPSIKGASLDILYTGPTRGTGPMTVANLWGNVITSAKRYAASLQQ
jgi:methylenetetrahydrofolate dehydrogenase (NADP+)/methenyltetrahydrofolate cyclohydrolase